VPVARLVPATRVRLLVIEVHAGGNLLSDDRVLFVLMTPVPIDMAFFSPEPHSTLHLFGWKYAYLEFLAAYAFDLGYLVSHADTMHDC